jgi:outer membrane protein assembly factor BamD (BamD/ComL family)
LFVVLGLAAVCAAQEDETYHERLEYDAATGEWVAIAPPVPGTEEGDLALGRSLLARGEYKKARKAFKKWFKAYPDSPHWPEALFYAAETEVSAEDAKPKKGHLLKAYRWLEELLEGWPGADLADRAIRKEMIIAEMLLFEERKQRIWGGMLWLSGKEEALEILDRIIDDWAAGTAVAEQALRLKGDYHFQSGEFEEAELAYARLVRDFPRGPYHKIALLRSGESALARFPGIKFDDADLLEAEVYLSDFQARYPQDAEDYGVPQKLGRIRDSRAEKDYSIGRYYERTRAIDAAAFYYRLVDRDWPDTTWAAEARNRLIALGALEPSEQLEPTAYRIEE